MRTPLLSVAILVLPVSARSQTSNYPIGSTVANFITLDTEGHFHTLYDYTAQGRTVFLDFFFYDCIPCQEYAPAYSELYDTYGCNQGSVICLSVNAGVDTDEMAEQFSVDFGGDFQHPPTIGQFNGGLLTDIFGVEAFPTLCVIAPDNTMWNDNVWPVDLTTLEMNFPEGTSIQPMSCTVGIDLERGGPGTELQVSMRPGYLTVTLGSSEADLYAVGITDAAGRSCAQAAVQHPGMGRITTDLPVPDLTSGLYLVTARAADGVEWHARVVVR